MEDNNYIDMDKEFVDEQMNISISGDKMKAEVIFYPPKGGGKTYSIEEVEKELTLKNIVYGIKQDILLEIKNNKQYYYSYEIAKGTLPIKGKDAKLNFDFNTDKKIVPEINEDGSVDFHKLNLINNIKEGDILVTLIPEEEGIAGKDVFGNDIPAPQVKKVKLPRKGRNIILSKDGMQLISEIDGQVQMQKDKISVYEVYTITKNVDNSTGDIEFNGSVQVLGNVLSGFSIKCKKNIQVNGIVEGATLIAGGNIIINSGIQGMDKARIICNGTLFSKYIYNAFVKVNGKIQTETILHSDISCNDQIIVEGTKGLISGGRVRANKQINAKVIGASLGTKTYIEVGVDPDVLEKYHEFKEQIEKIKKEMGKLSKIIELLEERKKQGKLSGERLKLLEKSIITKDKLKTEFKINFDKLNKLLPLIENTKDGKVKVLSVIHPGTIVTIGTQAFIVNNNIDRCTLSLEGAEVRVGPY